MVGQSNGAMKRKWSDSFPCTQRYTSATHCEITTRAKTIFCDELPKEAIKEWSQSHAYCCGTNILIMSEMR